MKQKFFGTDGIRGRVGQFPMTADFALKLGYAAGKILAAKGTKEVLIGKDTRSSGYMLESAIEAGLSAAGVNVALAGVLPTPAVAYLTSTFRADAGVVISASHNPFYDNGIKFFSNTGTKLFAKDEEAIEALLAELIDSNTMPCIDPGQLGKVRRIGDAQGRYVEFCKGTFPKELSLVGLKIVVDCANGAAYQVAPAVYRELGAKVIAINSSPNGININAECGATHMTSLQQAVIEHQADVGIALDGDADRVMLVDHQGKVVDGDEILFILAEALSKSGKLKGGVVGTLMSNLGLEQSLANRNIPFVRANVGDKYVVEQLLKNNWLIGGENSGHILALNHATTGDAIVASLKVLKVMVMNKLSLETLKQGMQKFPQVLINVRLEKSPADSVLSHPSVIQAVRMAEENLGNDGRVLLRKSGTEPLIRVMVEAKRLEQTKQQAEFIADVVRLVG
ncbi:phosphoglucosamine mutase [Shewanella gaetbuli]|uniref:Phosphoglucosamine mutase n=1 Tax=Shewanella gaetbuli TaxID=220752 RepID=A0A9X1ZMQ8_9GAMM|nr:phosphoglucosamine mutase [Shewanella gaetbuli]MCL1142330.1 phosphoglucosamine mutase [Shewanella gaetbuli]